MIIILLLSLILFRYFKAPRLLALGLAASLLALGYFHYQNNADENALIGLSVAIGLGLILCAFAARIRTTIDRLRLHKG
ncbi:MAG: hypothetical protein V4655_10280 [Bdellovibrionota bacterium]|nr:MAG: hypothetical protein EOP10_03595 [Pseudomonadota bacterium]